MYVLIILVFKIMIINESLNRRRLTKAASDLELNIVLILIYTCKMLVELVVNSEIIRKCL